MSLQRLLDEMMMDDGFKAFLEDAMVPPSPSIDVATPKPELQTLQLLNIDENLTAVTEALQATSGELSLTRHALQELVEEKALLQSLERQALNGLLEELGLTG